MNETFLHYLFESRKLGNFFHTTNGEQLEVISFGKHNKSSGPDFLEATVRYDNKIWAGHIEFHLRSSDWLKHGHQNDTAYRNVIAHFVLEHDKEIISGDYLLPVIELKTIVKEADIRFYTNYFKGKNRVACASFLEHLPKELIKSQMSIAFENRMRRKKEQALALMRIHKNDQMRVFMLMVAKTLGGKHNSEAMETLFLKIGFSTLQHIGEDQKRINSYLLGLSGLKPDEEFEYIKSLYQLQPMTGSEWRTYGMRPYSQPEKRVLQLGMLMKRSTGVKFEPNLKFWRNFFCVTTSNHGWAISSSLADGLIINSVIPFLLALAWIKGDTDLRTETISMMKSISAEQNVIIKGWNKLGIYAENSIESQALLELKNEFCNRKKCLFCNIGRKVLET